MAEETKHTIRFVIPKGDKEAWERHETFVEYLERKGYLREDGFTHGKSEKKPD